MADTGAFSVTLEPGTDPKNLASPYVSTPPSAPASHAPLPLGLMAVPTSQPDRAEPGPKEARVPPGYGYRAPLLAPVTM